MMNFDGAAVAAAAVMFLLAAPLAAERRGGVEAGGTVGSHEYYGVSLAADAAWDNRDLSPYARAEIMADSFQSALTVGGGAWKHLESGVALKGGLALAIGRVKNADREGDSWTLEAGAEQAFGNPILGAEYRLTSGNIATSAYGRGGQGRLSFPGGGSRVRSGAFTAHEISGYGRLPAGGLTLGARLTGYFTSNASSTLSETLSVSWPLAERLSASVAATFDDTSIASYISAGIRCRF